MAAKKPNPSDQIDQLFASSSDLTREQLHVILRRATEEPGVQSATIARELGIPSLRTSQLADRLVDKEIIGVFKRPNGSRTYFLPHILEKLRPKLEKEFQMELDAREVGLQAAVKGKGTPDKPAKTKTAPAPAATSSKTSRTKGKTEAVEAAAPKTSGKRSTKTAAAPTAAPATETPKRRRKPAPGAEAATA